MANERARSLRKEMTEAERRLWRRLRLIEMPSTHFRSQVPIGNYIADFCCHAATLIVEVDGGQHNDDEEAERDKIRTAWLNERGYRVLRFWNNDVLNSTDAVMETIMAALKDTPTPTPPLKGEGR